MRNTLIKFFILIAFIISSKNIYPGVKKLEISGLKIFKQDELLKKINVKNELLDKISTRKIIRKIYTFYKSRGYTLVKIYVIKNTPDTLSIYLDEGRLRRILYLNIDTIRTLKIKYKYGFPDKIFNIKRLRLLIRSMIKNEGYHDVKYRLKPADNFGSSIFQLDRELNLPIIGKTQLPFFEIYGSRYDLEFRIIKYKRKKKEKGGYVDYKLRAHYTKGFMPLVKYHYSGLLKNRDHFQVWTSAGIMYGIDGNFNDPPHMTFFEVGFIYHLSPMFNDYFTPYIRNRNYRSRASREDLGLKRYNYWLINSAFAPGLTLLKKVKIYTGIGMENARIFNSEIDTQNAFIANVSREDTNYPFYEIGLNLNISPVKSYQSNKYRFSTVYNRFFYSFIFNELTANGYSEFARKKIFIYTVKFRYKKVWGDVPFYHDIPVSSSIFKGFMGKSFHTMESFSLSNEIRTSFFREFIFVGLFFDAIFFDGTGYDLSGHQYGIVGGPSLRFLVLDQFEVYFFFGRDYLFSNRDSQFNLTFGLFKKW